MFRRSISLLLCLCMILTMLPAAALAEETDFDAVVTEETAAPMEETTAPAEEPVEETTAPSEPVQETTEPSEPEEPVGETTAPLEPEETTEPEETVPMETLEEPEETYAVFSETSGTCGENVTWTLADGVLTISGTGAMEDYGWGSAPWFESRDSILQVIVESGVTRVGSNAFGVLKAATVISLSDTVTSIGEYAFQTSQSLTKLSLPDSLETIEKYAFHGSGITQISLPDAVETLGEGLFMDCKALTTVEIGGNVTVLTRDIFWHCSALETVSLPAGITTIQSDVFVTSSLKNIYFAGTVDQWNTITIDASNTALFTADIYCENLLQENPLVAGGTCGYAGAVKWNLDQNGKLTIFGSGEMYNYYEPGTTAGSSGYGSMDAPWYTLRSNVKTLEIQEGVTSVGQYAFYNLTGITEVVIPESVLTVEEDAFRSCTALRQVEILGPVDTIYQNAFNGCTSLATLILHDGAKQILSHALEGCTNLQNVRFPASLTSIPSGLFEDCGKITSAAPIGSGCDYEFGWTTAIPNYAFMGLKNLTKVKLPYGLEKIGTGAFMQRLPNYGGLVEIEIPDGVTEIGASAFLNCTGLDILYLPGTLQTVQERAFSGVLSLTVYYAGTEEEWSAVSVKSNNDPLLTAEFVYEWYQSTYWKAVHLYSRWDEENQTVYLGDGTALYVTDATAPAWKENPAAYLGKYMLVTAERVETEEYNGYALVNMVPLQSEMGYVTSATDKRITINLASYDVPKNLKNPQRYVGKYVVYHLLNWSLLDLEELQSCEAYLTSWDPQTKMLGLRMDKLSDTPEQFYLYSDYEDVLGWLNSWDGKETIVKIRYDSNHCVYTLESEVVDGVFSYMFEGTQRFSYSYHYDEGWFDESSSTYQHDLTRMSLRMAMAAGDTRKGNVGEPYQNIAELMNELGFDYSETHSSYPDPEYDTIGYAIGSKEITSPGGQPRTLIMVGIRGIDYCDEWGGNFRIGSGMTEHEGFNLAAEQVVAGLKQYVAANRDSFHPTIQLWISGYSRGGATTNLTAAKIIDGAIPEIQPQNVYAFCFECPRNTTDPYVRSSKYRQIVNIINPIDFVTHVAMKNLGFDRYGTDYILPNIESTGTSRYKGLRDGLYASYLDILKWGYSDSTAIRMADEYITETKGQAEIFRKASDDLAEFVKDRTYYVLKYQTFFMDAFAMVMGGSELDGLVDAADSLAGMMIAVYKDGENFRDLAFWNAHFGSTLINSTLKYAHMPTLCLAWLETVDTLDPDANRTHERVFINCPVDVEVYSDGELVGQILDDIPQEIPNGILTEIDEDGQKILVLPGDGTYDIHLTATDDGEMTYTVTQQDSVSGDVSRVVSYQNVKIRKNDVLRAEPSSDLGVHSLKLQDGSDAVPDADLSGDNVRHYEVTVLAQGGGTAIGGGTYVCGEFAKVTAEPEEDVIFLGWYLDDVFVSGEKEYRFLVEQDASVTAKFAHKDDCSIAIAQQYLAVPSGETVSLEIEASHEILKSWVQWEVTEGTAFASVDEQGNVKTQSQGTAQIRISLTRDNITLTDRCRIDVTEALRPEGIQLSSPKATAELYSTGYGQLEVLLKLPQNYSAMGSQSNGQIPEAKGLAVRSARFADENAAECFHLIPLDDRRLAIVPTEDAVQNPAKVLGSYKTAVVVTVGDSEYTSEIMTLTVKKSMPKLKATVSAFNAFCTGQSQPIAVTGGTATAIYPDAAKTAALPQWLILENGTLKLKENAPKKSASAKAYLLVETEEWRIPAAVTVTVKTSYKAPALKLSAGSVTMTADAALSEGVALKLLPADKKSTLASLNVRDITADNGYSISGFNQETGTFTLKAGDTAAPGKISLKVSFHNTDNTLPLTLTVKRSGVKLKLSKTSVTLNKQVSDSAQITVTAAPADFSVNLQDYRLTDSSGTDKKNSGELQIRVSGNRIFVATTPATPAKATYRLYVSAGGSPEAALTVKTVAKTPTVTFKAKGSLDLTFPKNTVTVTPSFKNYSGGFTFTETETARIRLKQDGEKIILQCKNGASPGSHTLPLQLKLDDGTKVSGTVKITVKRSAVKLKLSATKLSLNKQIWDGGTVRVSCTTKDYDLRHPVWDLMDKSGKKSAGGKLDIFWGGDMLYIFTNDDTQYGATYKLLVRANSYSPAATLTITVPSESKSGITSGLKAKGTIDVIRDGTAVILTPSYKNVASQSWKQETLEFFQTVNGETGDAGDLFDYTANEDGTFTVCKAEGAKLDHTARYTVRLVSTVNGCAETISKAISLPVKQGSAKLTLTVREGTLFSLDRHSRKEFTVRAGDGTLNPICRIEIADAGYKDLFEIVDYGNGEYAIGFREGAASSVPAGKTLTLSLNVFLSGNETAKANTTLKLKLTVVK